MLLLEMLGGKDCTMMGRVMFSVCRLSLMNFRPSVKDIAEIWVKEKNLRTNLKTMCWGYECSINNWNQNYIQVELQVLSTVRRKMIAFAWQMDLSVCCHYLGEFLKSCLLCIAPLSIFSIMKLLLPWLS